MVLAHIYYNKLPKVTVADIMTMMDFMAVLEPLRKKMKWRWQPSEIA